MKNKKAQSSVELTIALIVVMVLLVGAARIFSIMNSKIVERQEEYEAQR